MATLEYSGVLGGGPGWTRVALPDGRVVTMRGDRAMRNNNPGNIEYGPFTRQRGALGSDNRFAVFPTRDAGIRAQSDLIFESPSYRNLTLAEAIARYAPAFENNTARYAATVAAMAGVPLDTVMSEIPAASRQSVLEAMHAVEGNTSARGFLDETGVQHWTTDTVSPPTPQIAPVPTPAPPAMAAPFGTVDRAPLPSIANTALANAHSDYARSRTASPSRPDNFNFAGPKGAFNVLTPEEDYFGPPAAIPRAPVSLPSAIDPVTVQSNAQAVPAAPAVSPMADNTPAVPNGFPQAPGFPAPPPAPGRKGARDVATGALAGLAGGGIPGAILGAVLGPARAQIAGNIRSNRQGMGRVGLFNGVLDSYRGLGGMFGNMGGLLSTPNYSAPSYGIGSGYSAINSAFGSPAGATAYSSSNPGISFTSLGNGLVSRSNADTGVTYSMSADDYN